MNFLLWSAYGPLTSLLDNQAMSSSLKWNEQISLKEQIVKVFQVLLNLFIWTGELKFLMFHNQPSYHLKRFLQRS